jgi:outer membrane protein assembly factor BamB
MIRVLFLFVLLLGLVGCGGETDNSEPPAELVEFQPSVHLDEVWSRSIGDGVEQQYLKLYPLMLDERMIVADRSGVVTALNLADGDSIWETDLDVVLTGGVGGDANNYIVTTRDGEVISLNAQGEVNWRQQVSSEVLVPAVVVAGRVIIRGVDGQIKALSVDKGEQLWVYKRDVPDLSLRGNSRLLVYEGRLFAGLDSGRLVILSVDSGQVLFDVAVAVPSGRSELERMVDIDGDAVIDQAVLYMASYQGRIVATDVNRGQLLWARNLSTASGVEVARGVLFSSDANDHIWALDRNNGATLWKQDKLKARKITRPTAFDDYLVVGDFEGYLHVMSQYDGRFVARVRLDDAGILVPPFVHGDRLYALSRDGELAAYRLTNL